VLPVTTATSQHLSLYSLPYLPKKHVRLVVIIIGANGAVFSITVNRNPYCITGVITAALWYFLHSEN
jgi:hypothetical protein